MHHFMRLTDDDVLGDTLAIQMNCILTTVEARLLVTSDFEICTVGDFFDLLATG